MKVLKKNQIAVLVIALMLVTAGYLNYTTNEAVQTSTTNTQGEYASIGDATLVNSGELLEEADKQNIINTINNSTTENTVNSTDNIINTQQTATTATTKEETDDYFDNSKLEREKMYSQMLETYQKLLESESISQEQKAVSEQEITKINQTKNAIMIAENLLLNKGFEQSVIFVNDTSVSVVVKADTLASEEIAQIQNIISRELNVDISNINITNR